MLHFCFIFYWQKLCVFLFVCMCHFKINICHIHVTLLITWLADNFHNYYTCHHKLSLALGECSRAGNIRNLQEESKDWWIARRSDRLK